MIHSMIVLSSSSFVSFIILLFFINNSIIVTIRYGLSYPIDSNEITNFYYYIDEKEIYNPPTNEAKEPVPDDHLDILRNQLERKQTVKQINDFNDEYCIDLRPNCTERAEAGECNNNNSSTNNNSNKWMTSHCRYSCHKCDTLLTMEDDDSDTNDDDEENTDSQSNNNKYKYNYRIRTPYDRHPQMDLAGRRIGVPQYVSIPKHKDSNYSDPTTGVIITQQDVLNRIRQATTYMKEQDEINIQNLIPTSYNNDNNHHINKNQNRNRSKNHPITKISDICYNQRTLCSIKASLGHCDIDPEFMIEYCSPVCFTCHALLLLAFSDDTTTTS